MTFCSRLSLDAREPAVGTGVRGQAYVFLPVAKRFWHDHEMNRQWASEAELEAIRAARQAGVVTRLYNPQAEEDGAAPPAVLVYPAGAEALAGVASLLSAFHGRFAIDAEGTPRLAVCTHGTRDRCCAKFGFAAFQAARRLFEEGASPFAPIECSHLGGDRFAATGVFFPSGSMYAHLGDGDLGAVCALEAAGRIAPETYRGRVFEGALAQLVRAGLAAAGVFNDSQGPIAVTAPHGHEVEARAGGRLYRIRLREAEVQFYGSCHKVATARLSRGKRTYVEAVEAVEPRA